MKRHFVRSAVGAVLALTALSSSVSSLAADPPAPGTLLIVAGTGEQGLSGDGGMATQARLNGAIGLTFDARGNLFIGERANARVRKVTPEGIISTVVGGGNTAPGPVDGIPAAEAKLPHATNLTFDGAGNLFIAAFHADQVWRVSPDGLIATVYKSSGNHVAGMAVDAADNLFIANYGSGQVRKRTPDGTITTIVGKGSKPAKTADGGPAVDARLLTPFDLAVDGAGNLFIADADDNRVRRVSPDGIITTVAGNGTPGFSGDGGPATQAQLRATSLTVDSLGNLFIADWDSYRVRKVTPDGIISTVAGIGTSIGKGQLSGVGGPAISAGLRGPIGLAIDAAGNLLIADTAWVDQWLGRGKEPVTHHVLMVVGVAAPGLVAGRPFPKP